MKKELGQITQDLNALIDAIYVLENDDDFKIQALFHEKIVLPLKEVMAKVENTEAKIFDGII